RSVDGTAEAAVAARVDLDRIPEVPAGEIGPEGVEEDHLRIGALPEHEVARALLPRAADEEVHIGQLGLVQVALDGLLADPGRLEPARGDLLGDALHGIRDLR